MWALQWCVSTSRRREVREGVAAGVGVFRKRVPEQFQLFRINMHQYSNTFDNTGC